MKILNLGCGTKVSAHPDVANVDWSIYLRLKKNSASRLIIPYFLGGVRLQRFKELPDNIIVHDLARGIPAEADSVDVVYHSHFFEHLDREIAEVFLEEVKRVLRPGGVHRIVVPDFEKACRDYVSHLALCERNAAEREKHDEYVALLIEQSVRKNACGTSQQKPIWRFIENLLRGDARRRGETHQWMYDRFNLSALLLKHGYKDPIVREFNTSSIPDWPQYGLDMDASGNEYKPESLYIEAMKCPA